jgi:hypothetical protein
MMKKSILSLAVTGAFAAGSASAALQLQADGIGHILVVPYFTVQNGNSTLLNIVNTDTVNGKAVKVRFRGGRDSDDIFDFQLFMSPGDVWTANLSQNASGLATLSTSDLSCTLPNSGVLNSTPFVLGRLSASDQVNGIGTREGYVEIFNMADIPSGTTSTNPVFATIKHTPTGGAPTCIEPILASIEAAYPVLGAPGGPVQNANNGTVTALLSPSTGLMANWTIINVPQTTAFSGDATAIEASTGGGGTAPTRIVYSQQTQAPVAAVVSSTAYPGIASTFDGVLLTPGFATAEYDFPDMSTPYEIATASAGQQAYDLSRPLAHTSITNEFLLETGIAAKTDWLVSMPTRRYQVAGRGNVATGVSPATAGFYAATAGLTTSQANTLAAADACANESIDAYGSCTWVGNGTTAKEGAQGFFRGVTQYAADGRSSCVSIGQYAIWNREEVANVTTNVVISPNVVTPVSLCGEVNILSLNNLTANTGAIGANLVVAGLNVPYQNGWATVNLNATGHTGGLPVIGQAYVKATNPAVSAGVSGNFGANWMHRWNGRNF